MSSTNKILRLYKSRKTILDLLRTDEYDVSDYDKFSINEIDAMFTNDQLDMLIKHENEDKKTYIKYFLTSKQIRPQNLDNIIEDLFLVESVLTKNDTLIIIIEEEPNETILAKLQYLYSHDGIFVVIHNIQRLQFNILNHSLVPKIKILKDSEIEDLKTKFNLKGTKQLPEIGRFDPMALAHSMRPGQVCLIERNSVTALNYNYYRVCV
jgi:DNA-directed RNA polymerase subunit H (RpoH/RPB5)